MSLEASYERTWLGKSAHLVFPGAGDLAVVLGAGIQVVIVGSEAGLSQLLRLLGRQHAQRGAHLHAIGTTS